MGTFLRDLRYAFRTLRHKPGFTLVALFVLALGIGANTAIFSVVNSVLLRPLPFPGSDRLTVIWETDLKDGIKREGPSGPNFLDWREQSQSFDEMALLEIGTGTVTGGGEPEQIVGLRVTTNFLSMLGARTVLGRDFTAAEGAGQARYPVTVLTNGYWKRRFASDPRVIGKTFILNSEPYTVIGVLSPEFWQPLPADLFVPWPVAELRARERASHDFGVFARLKPNVSVRQAQSELSAIARRIDAQTPRLAGWDVTVVPMKQALFEYLRPALLLLLGAVGLLLLLACVNVASLLLARVIARRKEMAIRAALGARKGRLIAQILSESLLLSLLGGALGVYLASWGVDILSSVLPRTLPLADAGAEVLRPAITVDTLALLFAVGVSVVAALVFGLIPALFVGRADVHDALKVGGRTSAASAGRLGVWNFLVVGEIALASMLLVGAGLAMKSFVSLQRVNPGIRPDHVLTFRMRLPTDTLYKSGREQAEFYRRVLDHAETLPGVQSAGLTDVLPLGEQNDREYFTIENRPMPAGESLTADFRRVSTRYFDTMGIPLRRGRELSLHDIDGAPLVVLVDETLAHQYFPHEDPLGQRLRLWGQWRQIVGIVGQVHHYGLDKLPEPTIYAPFEQMADRAMVLVVRTDASTMAMVQAVKKAVWSVDKGQPVFQIRTMNDYLALADTAPRISTLLLAIFAAISVLLAAMGIHGVVSYGVAQRTHEFGLRMALGSTPGQLKRLVLVHGIRTALIGLAAGMAGAAALASGLRVTLYGVAPLDPAVMAGVAGLLFVVALAANYIPAHRATRIDPMQALHQE
ncbi:MAG TPA: ABC transporter permease [Bryobacteraceae bacterium]|jgi:putative ABC transport system permease protein|nr:ABC transporter permease [Bryobacteraceae bacterium]